MTRRLLRRLCVLALGLAPLAAMAQSGAYPSRPIRLIVPYPAGGPSDFFGRTLAGKLGPLNGQSIVIENRAGASGTTGTDYVVKSPADGYTLILTSGSALLVAPTTVDPPPYDAFKELAPITLVVKVPEAAVAIPKLGVHTLRELVAKAKAAPGKINFASAGSGGLPHLAGELLKREAGIDLVHIPYKGAAPAVNDMLGGHVDMMFADLPVLLAHIQAGTLVPLAVASKERAPTLPDLPTTGELGFPTVLADNWYGLLAPAATPPDILQTLSRAAVAALRDPEVKATLARQGAAAVGDTPEEFLAFMHQEAERWVPLAKAAGARLE